MGKNIMAKNFGKAALGLIAVVFLMIMTALMPSDAGAFTLTVKDYFGNPVENYRWLVEEDTTHPVKLNTFDPDSLGVSIARSYSPVVASGFSASSTTTINVPDDKRYYVTVLPDSGYTLSGRNVNEKQAGVQVTVQPYPIPTAQLSVKAFIDNAPTNGVPDIGEQGLEGFGVLLFDNLGQVTVDVFGNNLGTTYVQNPDGTYQFDEDGAPVIDMMGNGILTDADGFVLIKNLAQNKYGVRVVPRDGKPWVGTSTIEGTPLVDAWIKAGEPPFFNEFGLLFYHAFFGFTLAENNIPATCGAGGTDTCTGSITGQMVYIHSPRPPDVTVHEGSPPEDCWVGLTPISVAAQGTIYTSPCGPNGTFSISSVPPGTYQIVMWDVPRDVIIGFATALVTNSVANPDGDPIDMGVVPVNAWFGNIEGYVFNDLNENGFMDPGEEGMSNQNINLRFRDGSIYKAQATGGDGSYGFPEVFPWFRWIVAEVDFLRYKATGATVWVDNGGPLSLGGPPPLDKLTPQPQPDNGGADFRIELSEPGGPVLTEGVFSFADQTNRIDWGKVAYPEGENGGISGVIGYQTTRAEQDPREAAIDPWEPGIPRVVVNLYMDANMDGVIDDLNGDGKVTLSDVDNYPFDNFPGSEDIDRNGNGMFDGGDAVQTASSDSWDDNSPTGCVTRNGLLQTEDPDGQFIYNGTTPFRVNDCAEALQTWNQVRPALFDGGYAFTSYFPGGIDSGSEEAFLPAGIYIVEVVPPPGYDFQKEEDYNVEIGDAYAPQLLLPPCVGDMRVVPDVLSLDGASPAPFAGETRPLCDRKQILLGDGQNAAADFHLFTLVPKAGRFVGLVTNDLVNTLNPLDPNAAEKLSPSWLPISIQDFRGAEVSRTYTDQYGVYNVLIPSSYTPSVPTPSGVAPHMVTICLNHPGPIEDPLNPGRFITDPQFNPAYGQACYNMDAWPAKTTIVDTPVFPLTAFSGTAGGVGGLLDCEYPDKTPLIYSVSGPFGGPYVSGPEQKITIQAVGDKFVDNPDFEPLVGGSPQKIVRDYGFGGKPGKVTIGGVPLKNVVWASDGRTISGVVPAGASTGDITVTRGDNGSSTPVGVTLHIGPRDVMRVIPGRTIQTAIDHAAPGTLILVPPGTYFENLIMWKPVRLQGWGAGSTVIDGTGFVPDREQAWLDLMDSLVASGKVELIEGQDAFTSPELEAFPLSSGAGITVIGNSTSFLAPGKTASIDGFTLRGSVNGGGIFANGRASGLRITNNVIRGNQGNFGGGVRLGWFGLPGQDIATYDGSLNDDIVIARNHIAQNGAFEFGGGVAIYGGSDNYSVTGNFICGNFSRRSGGGIAHYGLSDGGRIENNRILYNESWYVGTVGGEGGGIFLSGEPAPIGAPLGTFSMGAGDVMVNSNLIQGNIAGKGGGGICTRLYNGQDVQAAPGDDATWHGLDILNNVIVNNLSQFIGGGIELSDTAKSNIVHNTVAHNDSTATHVEAFGGIPNALLVRISTPVAAGIVSRANSQQFASLSGQLYPDPALYNNIIYKNRSWYWDVNQNAGMGGLLPNPTMPFWDLDVYGTIQPQILHPEYSILFDATGYSGTNMAADPQFRIPYFNTIYTAATAQEGGNFVSVIFNPLKIVGDYRIRATSPAREFSGTPPTAFTELDMDIEGQRRPYGAKADAGADEYTATTVTLPAFAIPPGPESVRTSRSGTASGSGTIPAGASLYSVSGTAKSADGSPIAGAAVELSGGVSLNTETDSEGKYAFAGVPEGRYEIKASKEGLSFERSRRTVTVRGADANGQDFIEK